VLEFVLKPYKKTDESSSEKAYDYSQVIDYKQNTKSLEVQNAHETHKPNEYI